MQYKLIPENATIRELLFGKCVIVGINVHSTFSHFGEWGILGFPEGCTLQYPGILGVILGTPLPPPVVAPVLPHHWHRGIYLT